MHSIVGRVPRRSESSSSPSVVRATSTREPAAEAGEAERDRGDVRRGRAGQEDVGGRELECGDGAGDHPAERFVRVRDALGFAGAAGGEEDERRRRRGAVWEG